MKWQRGWRRFTRLWQSDTVANVDEELQFHFEQKVAEFEAQGLSVAAARLRAEEEFGDVQQVRTSLQEIDRRVAARKRRAEWWEGAAQDLRYVLRTLRKAPAFTATVVATLALGLGANAALFSVLDKLYVQEPSGVRDSHELRRVYRTFKGPDGPFVYDRFTHNGVSDLRRIAPPGISIASYNGERERFGTTGNRDIGTTYVEGDYFGILGARAQLGRLFTLDEGRIEGLSLVAVISHRLWRTEYQGDPQVVGRTIDVASHRHTIVGVASSDFTGLDIDVPDIWLPRNSQGILSGRALNWYEKENGSNAIRAIARVSSDAAARYFEARATQALRANKQSSSDTQSVFLRSIIEARGGALFGQELSISMRLAGVTIFILLIAAANIVNLMLARAAMRQREIAVRLALGVSRRRLLLQLMTESSVLATLSAGVALFVAYVGANALRTLLLPNVHWSSGAIGVRVAVFTVVLALLTGFAAGLVPALQSSRPNLSNALKASVRDGGRRRSGLRSGLLVAQAALSVVLLVGAGVLVRSLRNVEAIDTGFDTQNVLYASVDFDAELGNRREEIQQRMPEVLERIQSLPGVEKAAFTNMVAMSGFSMRALALPGRDSLPPGKMRIAHIVSPDFYSAVGLRVLRGRDFTNADRDGGELVMAVDENLANNFWPGENALTKCVIVGKRDTPCRRVIAVVSPAHFAEVVEEPSMHYYLPAAQQGNEVRYVVVRTTPGRINAVGAAVSRDLSQMFGAWALPRITTMEAVIGPKVRPWRVGATTFTIAGLLALLVAAVGVYSSIAYTISQRTQEMGVRVALGASSADIVQLVVGSGVRVVAAGVALGVGLAMALGKLIKSLLYETSPSDPLVMVGASATLLLAAIIASAIPAWRASRADPLAAMRAE